MNSVERLIQEHCPEGVPFLPLGEVLDYEQPSKYIVESTNYSDDHKTPVLTAGASFILGYTNETEGIYKASKTDPVIIFDDFTTSYHWVDFDFKVKSSAMKMLKPKKPESISFRYLYYAFSTIQYKPIEHARQWISIYSRFQVPVPPRVVQEEIVRILDTFSDLAAELQAELQARELQYKYYLNKLLTFDPDTTPFRPLGEIGTFVRGSGLQRKDFTDEGFPCIHYGQIHTYYGLSTNETISHCSPELARKLRKAKYNDVILASVSEDKEACCKPVVWLGKGEVAVSGDTIIYNTDKLNGKYVAYYLSSYRFNDYKKQYAQGAKVIRLHINKLKQFSIPVPPREVQEEIVIILDKFETLTTSLTEGLPKEIALRQQQYEYYRDRLLTFKPLEP